MSRGDQLGGSNKLISERNPWSSKSEYIANRFSSDYVSDLSAHYQTLASLGIAPDVDGRVSSFANLGFKSDTDFGREATPSGVNKVRGPPPDTGPSKASAPLKEERDPINTWAEFTEETTLHGIKYVFRPTSKRKRFLWGLAVWAAVFLFLYQVINRGYDYFSYRTTVNVEVRYPIEIDFPSVTLCNQNSYRLTETVRRDMYSFITEVYSGTNFVPDNQTTIGADDLLTFVNQSAHQKNDMIDSCTWKGQPCDLERDFVTTLTDFGVCYTFNPGLDGNNFKLSQPGSGYALSIVLNIESYEYMKGPHNEAGMKALLHDSSEVPLVQDLGFAIAPGTNTLVAVNRGQIHNLETPYGHCVKGIEARSHCTASCRAQEALEACGCLDVYMPNVQSNETGTQVCPVLDAYTCLENEKAARVTSNQTCICPSPCDGITYSPELSYAHLSSISVDTIWGSDEAKKRRLYQSYIDARETYYRVDKAVAGVQTRLYTDLLQTSQMFSEGLTRSYMSLSDPDTLQSLTGSRNSPLELLAEVVEDLTAIEGEHTRLWDLRSTIRTFPNTSLLNIAVSFIDQYFLGTWDTEPFSVVRKLEECADLEANGNLTTVEFTAECDTAAQPLRSAMIEANPEWPESYDYVEPVIRRFIKVLQTTLSGYQDIIETLYWNTTEWDDVSSSPSHLECLELLQNITETWIPKFNKIKDQLAIFYNTDSYAERRDVSYVIWELSNATKANGSVLNVTNNACSWYQVEYGATDPSYSLFAKYMTSAESAFLDSSESETELTEGLNAAMADYSVNSAFMFGPFQQYLDQNRTKMDLFHHLESVEFQSAFLEADDAFSRAKTDANSLKYEVKELEGNLQEALRYSFNFSVWVMRDTFVQNLKMVKYLERNYPNDQILQMTLASVSFENGNLISEMIRYILDTYLNDALTSPFTETSPIWTQLELYKNGAHKELREFNLGNQLNKQFFMDNYIKVDIFYKELKYAVVSQQVAFEFISYLSEIGGFMGLLLGASLLTVFELVDFLILACRKWCRNNR